MAKYEGVRERIKGKRYEVNFRPYKGAKSVFRNIEAMSMSDAYYKRLQLIAEYQKGLSVPEEDRIRLTADFANMWERLCGDLLAEKKPKKTIGKFKKVYWRMFGDFREKKYPHIKDAAKLHLSFFREYRNYYANDLKRPQGLRGELIVVKAIMNRLYMLGHVKEELIKQLIAIKKPPPNKKEYPNISKSAISKLFSHIRNDRSDYYYPLYFMLRTGRRKEETTLIRKDDVILNGFRPIAINIRVETTKTKEKTPLNVLDEALECHIRQALSNNKTEWLFPNKWGRKCTRDKICAYLKRISQEVIDLSITPHYFRHRFITECAKANAPIADVKAITGIKDSNVLLKYYSHATPEGQKQVLNITRL